MLERKGRPPGARRPAYTEHEAMKDGIAHRQGNVRQCAFELIGRSSELTGLGHGAKGRALL
jgi:hypothetical protein